jgi:hypothetical protein
LVLDLRITHDRFRSRTLNDRYGSDNRYTGVHIMTDSAEEDAWRRGSGDDGPPETGCDDPVQVVDSCDSAESFCVFQVWDSQELKQNMLGTHGVRV